MLSGIKEKISSVEKNELFTTDTKTWDGASFKFESDKVGQYFS